MKRRSIDEAIQIRCFNPSSSFYSDCSLQLQRDRHRDPQLQTAFAGVRAPSMETSLEFDQVYDHL